MSDWTVAASTPVETETLQAWALDAFHQAKVRSFVGRFMGEGPDNIVQMDRRFEKGQGDTVNLDLVKDIDADLGIAGSSSTDLEGAEVVPTVQSDSVLLDALRQAIRTRGKLDEQRFAHDTRMEIKDKLAYWAQRRIFDGPFFRKMSGLSVVDSSANTVGEAGVANDFVILGGDVAAVNNLSESNTVTLQDISDAKACAESGEFGSVTMPSKLRPLNIDGQDYYVYVGHTFDRYNLKQDPEWKDAVLQAEVRGKSNPLFTGVVAIWDGVLLFFHDQVVLQNNTPGVQYSTQLFLGAQAGYWIQAQPGPDWVEKTFDYGWKYGIGTAMMFGFDKVRFGGDDFAVIVIKSASKNPKA